MVFFALLANANEWVEIEAFAKEHEDFLRGYLELDNEYRPTTRFNEYLRWFRLNFCKGSKYYGMRC